MKNPVVSFEIQSPDPAALRAFYGELFDWHVQQHEAIDWRRPIRAYPRLASRYSFVSASPAMRMAVDSVWSSASYGQ